MNKNQDEDRIANYDLSVVTKSFAQKKGISLSAAQEF